MAALPAPCGHTAIHHPEKCSSPDFSPALLTDRPEGVGDPGVVGDSEPRKGRQGRRFSLWQGDLELFIWWQISQATGHRHGDLSLCLQEGRGMILCEDEDRSENSAVNRAELRKNELTSKGWNYGRL